MQEHLPHRSLHHLEEADPQACAIPSLTRQAEASFVAAGFDEYGGARGRRMHSKMFAALLAPAGLSDVAT